MLGVDVFAKNCEVCMEFFTLNIWAKEPLSAREEFSSEDEDEDTHTEN